LPSTGYDILGNVDPKKVDRQLEEILGTGGRYGADVLNAKMADQKMRNKIHQSVPIEENKVKQGNAHTHPTIDEL
jgi:hypothetical protein